MRVGLSKPSAHKCRILAASLVFDVLVMARTSHIDRVGSRPEESVRTLTPHPYFVEGAMATVPPMSKRPLGLGVNRARESANFRASERELRTKVSADA